MNSRADPRCGRRVDTAHSVRHGVRDRVAESNRNGEKGLERRAQLAAGVRFRLLAALRPIRPEQTHSRCPILYCTVYCTPYNVLFIVFVYSVLR